MDRYTCHCAEVGFTVKLLIVEDEPDMRKALEKGFLKRGFLVDTAEDGEEGAYLAQVNTYDVIVLDLNLPGKDGFEILQEIRKRSKAQKVIILSARSSVPDKVLGLDMGANDYLAKPFDFRELEARVRSLARREIVQKDTEIKIDHLVIDTAQKMVFHHGENIKLTPKEYAILEYLGINQGRTVSAEELIEHVWESDADLFSVSIKVHMSKLRKKLEDTTGKNYIETIRGRGYLLREKSR